TVDKDDCAADDEQRDPRRVHCAALPGMGDEQAGEADHHEERDHQRQVPHVADEQKLAPAACAAIEPILEPQKCERDRREAQHHAAGIVAWPVTGARGKSADNREHTEDEDLQPEAEPRPESAICSIGWGGRFSALDFDLSAPAFVLYHPCLKSAL